MRVNVATLGNHIYASVKDNAASCAAIRTEAASLALSLATDPNAAATVTSATVNGQTFTARDSMTQIDRLKMLRWVVKCLDNGGPISPIQQFRF